MNPIVMSMLVDAKLDDIYRETGKDWAIKIGQAGDGGKSSKKLETALIASGMIILLVVWAILVV